MLNSAAEIACRALVPGFAVRDPSDSLETIRAKALILQSYGHGNAPALPELIEIVWQFTHKGGLLLSISQVPQGCAVVVYTQDDPLRQADVLTADKCNLGTATTLPALAVNNDWDAIAVTKKLEED